MQFASISYEVLEIKIALPNPRQEHWNQLFWGKKTDCPVVLFSFKIQNNESGGPLKVEVLGQGCIGCHLQRNQGLLNEFNDFDLGVRNRTHLLAANSAGVEEIEENRFVFGTG